MHTWQRSGDPELHEVMTTGALRQRGQEVNVFTPETLYTGAFACSRGLGGLRGAPAQQDKRAVLW